MIAETSLGRIREALDTMVACGACESCAELARLALAELAVLEGRGGVGALDALSEVQLIALIKQAQSTLRTIRWSLTEFGLSMGIETDHIYHKGADKALCGLSNNDGKPLTGHPYFGVSTACLCKRCERSYKKLALPSVRTP